MAAQFSELLIIAAASAGGLSCGDFSRGGGREVKHHSDSLFIHFVAVVTVVLPETVFKRQFPAVECPYYSDHAVAEHVVVDIVGDLEFAPEFFHDRELEFECDILEFAVSACEG